MDYHDHPFWTERFESEAELRESNAISWTESEIAEQFGPNGPDEFDREIMMEVMDRDMAEREQCWIDENASLRSYVQELEDELYG